MPIYVYGCNACGATEEHIQRFSDPPLTECSSCGGRLEKQVTAAAFQLKGGGWYKDGYASAKADKGGGSDSGSTGDGGGKAKESSGSKGSGAKETSAKETSAKGAARKGSSGSSTSGGTAAAAE